MQGKICSICGEKYEESDDETGICPACIIKKALIRLSFGEEEREAVLTIIRGYAELKEEKNEKDS